MLNTIKAIVARTSYLLSLNRMMVR